MVTARVPYVFTDVFPIQLSVIPELHSYRLNIGSEDVSTIGGKLSYRLRGTFHGHWVWTNGKIVTDKPQEKDKIIRVVESLWQEQPETFRSLEDVNVDTKQRFTPLMIADFVARGLFSDIVPEVKRLLSQKKHDLGNAFVERVHEVRGWVVQEKPAVSISISSRLILKEDLKAYAEKISNVSEIIGLWVADKTSSLKGEITGVVGRLENHRKRLLAITQREEMQELISDASDNELVVRVRAERNEYDYVVSTLEIILRVEDFDRFTINRQQALKILKIEPQLRSELIREIYQVAKKRNLVLDAYDSRTSPALFMRASDVEFQPSLCFGGKKMCPYNERSLLPNLRKFGLYRRYKEFLAGQPICIGIINSLNSFNLTDFKKRLQEELQQLGFTSTFVGELKTGGSSRDKLETAINSILKHNPNIVLAVFPDDYSEDGEEWGAYHNFKSLTVVDSIPSQVVTKSTLNNKWATANIVLGILGKIGNIPFVLAEPLPYADLVVGIDIARERKERLSGSINATAITRIYFSNGEFLRYIIHDAPLEGETIPDRVLQSLFPSKDFSGKRVVIHRDGYFRGGEKPALRSWAEKIGAKFYLVEIIKTGTPRIYAVENRIQQPAKGSAFKLSETEAFLVSSLPPFTDATPQPLRVRTESPFTVEQAIHSILSLTLLHYGSLRPPRLPVTIQYSDRIAYLALRGIKPKNLEGNIPFWL